jgi:hypothetical protein
VLLLLPVVLSACVRRGTDDRLPTPGRRFDPVGTFVWDEPRTNTPSGCFVKITIKDNRLYGWISEDVQKIQRCALREFQLDRIRFDGKRLEFRVVCPGVACPQRALRQRIDVVLEFTSDDLAEGYVLRGSGSARSGLRRFPLRLVRVQYEEFGATRSRRSP